MTETTSVGSISEDGNWIWDGQQWQSYAKTEPEFVAPMNPSQELIKSAEEEFDTVDQNNDGVIDKEEYIARIMEETLEKRESEKAPDQIMKIMTIFILIFASCTGFISQKVSSIEAEASDLDAAADLKIADARASESSENQLLIKEEILLTEAQNLAIEIASYKNKISILENSLNQSITDYLKPAIEEEILTFVTYGYVSPSEYEVLPLENCFIMNIIGCELEAYIEDDPFDPSATLYINYTETGEEDLVDKSFETMFNNDMNFIEKIDLGSSIFYSFSILVEVNDDSVFLQDPANLSNYLGSNGILWGEQGDLEQTNLNLSDLAIQIDYTKMNLEIHSNNYANSLQYANYHGILAELIVATGGDINAYDENISLMNFFNSAAQSTQQQIDDNTTIWSELRGNIADNNSLLEVQTQWVENLQKDLDRTEVVLTKTITEMDSALDKVFSGYSEIDEISSSLTSAENLKSNLLNRSAAYNNGSIDNQTGLYISNNEQSSFTEMVHANSDAKYDAAQNDQQDAQEMNGKLTSVSTSVLFISVANMLLGIAGGFATNKDKKRNAMVMLVAGAGAGIIGAIQIIPLI